LKKLFPILLLLLSFAVGKTLAAEVNLDSVDYYISQKSRYDGEKKLFLGYWQAEN
jgi:hypothetical protein